MEAHYSVDSFHHYTNCTTNSEISIANSLEIDAVQPFRATYLEVYSGPTESSSTEHNVLAASPWDSSSGCNSAGLRMLSQKTDSSMGCSMVGSIRPAEASESQVQVALSTEITLRNGKSCKKLEKKTSLTSTSYGLSSNSPSLHTTPAAAKTDTVHTPRMSALFSMDETWLRATDLGNLLFGTSAILSSSQGGPDTYDMSYEVKQIDYFISHNWSASRWKKFMALFLHFCGRSAMLVAYCCASIGCVLNRFEVPPLLQFGPTIHYGIWCQVLGFTGFLAALLFSHRLLLCQQLGKPPLTAFLDKVCIHQTDEVKKQAGISKLGAFLRHSQTMIVLFNNLYCKKLWTVYELACFMYIHPGDALELIPLDLADVVFKSVLAVWGMILFSSLLLHVNSSSQFFGDDWFTVYLFTWVVIASVTYGAFSVTLRRWGFEQENTILDLQSFNVGDARCAIENDRRLVCKNIRTFVRAMQLVPDEEDDNAALEYFNTLVRNTMQQMLKDAVGRTGFPYKYAIMVCTPHDFLMFDYLSSQPDAKLSWIIGALIHGFSMRAVVIPVGFLLCASLCKRFPRREGVAAEVLTRMSIHVLTTLTVATLFCVTGSLQRLATESNSVVLLVGFFLLVTTMAIAIATVFSSRPHGHTERVSMARRHRESRVDADQKETE